MLELPLWRAGREATSLDSRTLLDYRGEAVARVHEAPAVLVHRVVAELRKAAPGPAEDPGERWRAIDRAGALLAGAALGGCSADDCAHLVTRATGTPLCWSRLALAELADGMRRVEDALRWQAPGGDLSTFASRRVVLPEGRSYAWVPVGRVLGFVAPSNHPAVHLGWIWALAMGWSVLLRPGADDPLIPWRLVLALQAAGFPTDRLAVLPGDHRLVPAMVAACDRTVAYGGQALADLLDRDARVLFNGPGQSKVLVEEPDEGEATVDFLWDCIVHGGGRKCTSASAILIRDEVRHLLEPLSERLAAMPLLDPLDPAALVPAWKDPAAARQTPAQVVVSGGTAFVVPGLVRCGDPLATPFGLELPAPWATAAELPAGVDPMPLLVGSLAVTLLSRDSGLLDACLGEPSIRKAFLGPVPPWHTEPGAPHHGCLADFLFTRKAFQSGSPPARN